MIYLPIGSKLTNISKRPKREGSRYKCYLTKSETGYCGVFYDDGNLKEEFCFDGSNKRKVKNFEVLSKCYEQFKSKSKKGFIEIYTDDESLVNAFEQIQYSASIDFKNILDKIKKGHKVPIRIYKNYTHKLKVLYLNSNEINIQHAKRVAMEIKALEQGKEIIILR